MLSNPGQAGTAGFAELAPVAAAWAWLDALAVPLARETVPLQAAYGRVLAQDVTVGPAAANPPRAAANGYAVRAAACDGASAYNPLSLLLLPPGVDVLPGTAASPMASGWALPAGADAVLPLDAGQPDGAGRLEVVDAVPRGAGVEAPPPTVELRAGRRLRPQDLGCLAASGACSVAVLCRPRVGVLVAGPKSGPDMLSPMLQALLGRDGATVETVSLADARPGALAAALRTQAAAACDLLMFAGRAGAGIDDSAAAQVRASGGSIALHGLALRPGGSAGLGSLPRGKAEVPLLLLPGDPAGCLAAYDLLAARLVRRLAGMGPALPYPTGEFALVRKVVSGLGSMDVVALRVADGQAEPVAAGAGLAGATQADGFILVAEGSEGHPAGARVCVHLYGSAAQGSLP